MKPKEDYQKELNEILQKMQHLETQRQPLQTRAIELQGILKEVDNDKPKDK